jgi:hypothetical protein
MRVKEKVLVTISTRYQHDVPHEPGNRNDLSVWSCYPTFRPCGSGNEVVPSNTVRLAQRCEPLNVCERDVGFDWEV